MFTNNRTKKKMPSKPETKLFIKQLLKERENQYKVAEFLENKDNKSKMYQNLWYMTKSELWENPLHYLYSEIKMNELNINPKKARERATKLSDWKQKGRIHKARNVIS